MSNKENGLMKKTKAQLVEIILRKDDEEIHLKNAYEDAKKVMFSFQKDVEEKDETIKRLTDSLNKANRNVEQHQAGMDEVTSQKVAAEEAAKKFEKERNSARGWNWVLATAVVIIAALWILL